MNSLIETALVVAILVALADRVWTRWKARKAARAAAALAKPAGPLKERDYQLMAAEQLRAAGLAADLEFVLDDGARVDIVTPAHAVEVDFPCKWAECVGQALYYALKTGKAPVCLLVVNRDPRYEPGVGRCAALCKAYRIQFWRFDAQTLTLLR